MLDVERIETHYALPLGRKIPLYPAVLEVHLPARVLGDARLVGHQQDGLALPVQGLEQAQDLLAGGAVEISGRLVGQQDAG